MYRHSWIQSYKFIENKLNLGPHPNTHVSLAREVGALGLLIVFIVFTSASLNLNLHLVANVEDLVANVEGLLPLLSKLFVSTLSCWPCNHQWCAWEVKSAGNIGRLWQKNLWCLSSPKPPPLHCSHPSWCSPPSPNDHLAQEYKRCVVKR